MSKRPLNFTLRCLRWFFLILKSIIRWSSKCVNLAFHTNFVTWYFWFSQRYVKWNSCFLPKTWKLSLVFFTTGEIQKEVRYLMKKWKRDNFVLLKTQIFFFTEKQRTNLISNNQRIQSCTPCCHLYIFQEIEPIHQFASTSSNSSNSPSGSTLKVSAMRWMSKRRENIQLRQRKNSTTNGRMRNESSDKPLNGAQKET